MQTSDSKAHLMPSVRPPVLLAKAAWNYCLHSKISPLQKLCPSHGDLALGQGFSVITPTCQGTCGGTPAPGQDPSKGTLKTEQSRAEGKTSLRIQNEKMKCLGRKEAFQRSFHLVPALFERLRRDGNLGVLLAKILAFSAHLSLIKNMESLEEIERWL